MKDSLTVQSGTFPDEQYDPLVQGGATQLGVLAAPVGEPFVTQYGFPPTQV